MPFSINCISINVLAIFQNTVLKYVNIETIDSSQDEQ